jgi:hypothetical protein
VRSIARTVLETYKKRGRLAVAVAVAVAVVCKTGSPPKV